MNTAKYILKKAKIIENCRKLEIKKSQSVKPTKKLKSSTTKDNLENTYSLLSHMYSKENNPLFI